MMQRQADEARQRADKASVEQRQTLMEARRRNELIANENQKFEELYRQNRTVLSAYRSKEESLRASAHGYAASSVPPDAACTFAANTAPSQAAEGMVESSNNI